MQKEVAERILGYLRVAYWMIADTGSRRELAEVLLGDAAAAVVVAEVREAQREFGEALRDRVLELVRDGEPFNRAWDLATKALLPPPDCRACLTGSDLHEAPTKQHPKPTMSLHLCPPPCPVYPDGQHQWTETKVFTDGSGASAACKCGTDAMNFDLMRLP